ncbi:hypothetical protein SISSUDRAFT_712194 [Sistotremastrum suecicum HHB10207 ss-3]|uniref:Uncharacterized protein n=1 Tax=Sistotremastrum suecicum HHB10207 ss-3 TaxID=1314776 RepID=A0A166DSG1_9AGAM|nr:hypothetical protein SISSUDRAFT_712194 [Sistotremastrum suecicum HHB10207 ss-3]
MPCHTDTISVSKISLRGSLLVCLSKRQNMLVINWENNTGISYTNTGNSNGWELTGPWEAYIHPHLPLIICTIEEHHPDAHSPNWSRRKVCVVDVPHELPPLRKTITDISLSSEEFPYASSALLPDDLGVPVPWFDLRERTPNLSSLSVPICSMHNSWGLNRDEMVSPLFNLSGDSMSVQARVFCAKITSVWMVGGSESNPIHRTLAYQPPLPDIYKPFLPDPVVQSDGLRWTRVLIPPDLRMQRENWPENTSLPYRFEVVGVDLAYGGFYVERYNDSLSAPDRCLYCIQY